MSRRSKYRIVGYIGSCRRNGSERSTALGSGPAGEGVVARTIGCLGGRGAGIENRIAGVHIAGADCVVHVPGDLEYVLTGVPAVASCAVVINRTGSRASGCQIISIAVLQLGRHSRNLYINVRVRGFHDIQICICICTRIRQVHQDLVGDAVCDSIHLHHSACFAGNGSAIASGVEITRSCIQRTGYMDLGIHQISRSAGIGLAGSIFYRNKGNILLRATDVTPAVGAPARCIVNVDAHAGVNGGGSAGTNVDLRSGQQRHILGDANIAAVSIHGNVAIDGQHVGTGINLLASHIHSNRRQADIAIGVQYQTVFASVILLHNVAIGHGEHTAAAADKGNRRSNGCAVHVNRGKAIFRSAGMQGQGNLNVLHIILAEEEYLLVIVQHFGGGLRAAAEVTDLEQLVDRGTALGSHSACAGNVTVGIQGTAVIDGDVTAVKHIDPTLRAGGSGAVHLTRSRAHMLTGHTQRAIDHQVGTTFHG